MATERDPFFRQARRVASLQRVFDLAMRSQILPGGLGRSAYINVAYTKN